MQDDTLNSTTTTPSVYNTSSAAARAGLDGVTIVRTTAKETANEGDIINQTITVNNECGYEISNVIITDTITEGGSFVSSSVVIGGVSYPYANPINGFSLNVIIPSGNSETVTYNLKIDSPVPDDVTAVRLTSNMTYNVGRLAYSQDSNTIAIDIPHGIISIAKTSDKSAVIRGQRLKFQSVVKNTGNLNDTNVFFQDNIPSGTTFIPQSVTIDDVPYPDYHPQTGFSLDTIDANTQKTVTFEVTVD